MVQYLMSFHEDSVKDQQQVLHGDGKGARKAERHVRPQPRMPTEWEGREQQVPPPLYMEDGVVQLSDTRHQPL